MVWGIFWSGDILAGIYFGLGIFWSGDITVGDIFAGDISAWGYYCGDIMVGDITAGILCPDTVQSICLWHIFFSKFL